MSLVEVTAPTTEPVDYDEATVHLKIDDPELEESLIRGYILAATDWAQEYCRRQFITATYRFDVEAFPSVGEYLEIPRAPLIAITGIQYLDDLAAEQTLNAAIYRVDPRNQPGRLYLAADQSWPAVAVNREDAVRITFTCGYGSRAAVPRAVRHAILLLAGHLYANREQEAVVGRSGFSQVGFGTKNLLDTVSLREMP